jgi:anaerobic dimethyl sulfoxide reductase subunit C (anchor subunit)
MAVQVSLIVFTLFVAMAAGVFALQGVLVCMGKGKRLQLPALIVAFVAMVVGGIGSFTHLQHWDRAFNGFGHITSGITQELIGIVILFVCMVIFFVIYMRGRKEADKALPKWCGVVAILAGALMIILMTTSYMMASRPMWDTFALYIFYFTQAFVVGAAVIWLLAGAVKDTDLGVLPARLTAVGGVLVVLSLLIYMIVAGTISLPSVGYYFDPTEPTSAMHTTSGLLGQMVGGSAALEFWLGLIIGGLVPAILGFLGWKPKAPKAAAAPVAATAGDGATAETAQADAPAAKSNALALGAASAVCALVGGFAFRVLLYMLAYTVFVYY